MKIFPREVSSKGGFTLVELLIVIALIAILAVGVLSTINPVEQRNKATDANTANDAGEVLGALERYYTNQSVYPWMMIDSTLTADAQFGAVSNVIGFGLCGTNASTPGANDACSAYNKSGSLVAADELKSSFLQKNYTRPWGTGANKITFIKALYLLKQTSAEGNAIYVCYVPSAKTNRTQANNLKVITVDDADKPTKVLTLADAADSLFEAGGNPISAMTFADVSKSLFKCVP
jgi:prepilin-type N-terminal cleavage/methylation domain-containing protein